MTGVTGTLQVLVKTGKRVDRAVAVRLVDGDVADVGEGEVPEADVTLSLTPDEAAAAACGALDLTVAYMRGTMKMAGDPGLLLKILPLAATESFQPVRAALAPSVG